jgi:mono/diheme cytochrome c family protein
MTTKILVILLAVLIFGSPVFAEVTVKKVPVQSTPANSATEMYGAYCASCHGKDGKGNGPAAPALKMAPSDLTTMAKRNSGKFPIYAVLKTLESGIDNPAHGNVEMPIWGTLFQSLNANDGTVKLRMYNLARYIEGLQVK